MDEVLMYPQESTRTLTALFQRDKLNVVLLLQGPPGIGKTASVGQAAKHAGYLFNRAVSALRAEHRTGPSISGSSCYSVRQRTEKPPNRKYPEPLETRPDQFDGPVTPIWHQPDHLTFDKAPGETQKQFEERVFAKPRYTGEHVVMLGDKLVPATEIYSQGENCVVRGEEVIVTDLWAVNYSSGWRQFVDPRIRLHKGDRQRDEFFEPTEEQLSSWRENYTSNGEFNKKTHPRFRRTLHRWLFKNQTEEAPPISRGVHPKELERDFNDVYGDGVYAEGEQPEDAEHVDQVEPPKPGGPWSRDNNFVRDLTQMLPKGYPKLQVYQSGLRIPLPDDLQLAPPRDLDKSTYLVTPTADLPCPIYLVPQTELESLHSSSVGVGGASDCGLVEFKRRTRMLGKLAPIAPAEQTQCERILRGAADYDQQRHELLGHLYEYNYKYYPGELLGDGFVFQTVKNTTKSKHASDQQQRIVTWGDAIQNTFGHLVEETPSDGFYVMYKLTGLAATRVYLILPSIPIDFDVDEQGEPVFLIRGLDSQITDFDAEAPVPFGIRDIHGQIRTVVSSMRTTSKTPTVIADNLRKIVQTYQIKHVRFTWDEIRGLTWVLSQ